MFQTTLDGGALIYCNNIKDIPDIVDGIMTNKERNTIMSKLSKLTRDDLFYTEEVALEWAEWERKSIQAEAENKGKEEGREKGIEETILSMVENNLSLELISKITNKTIEEINVIIKEQ